MFQMRDYHSWDMGKVPAKIFRISFSGELAYEINVSVYLKN